MLRDPKEIKNSLEMYILDVARKNGPQSGRIALGAAIDLLADTIEGMTVVFDDLEHANTKAFFVHVINKLRDVKEEM